MKTTHPMLVQHSFTKLGEGRGRLLEGALIFFIEGEGRGGSANSGIEDDKLVF